MGNTETTNLSLMGQMIRRLREENRLLKEENARLRGERTAEQTAFEREDAEVFGIVKGTAKPGTGLRVVLR